MSNGRAFGEAVLVQGTRTRRIGLEDAVLKVIRAIFNPHRC